MIRWKNDRPFVEAYDPAAGRKRHIKPAEFGMDPAPRGASRRELEKWAHRLEAKAAEQFETGQTTETIQTFADRWTTDFPRGASTNIHNSQSVAQFVRAHGQRTLASIQPLEGRRWGYEHKAQVPALRALFNDAKTVGLVTINPFAQLGIEQSKGRADITPLTVEEIDALANIARDIHGPLFGPEIAAMITWAAYTCMRPGEIFAAKHSQLHADTYQLTHQYNTRLGEETQPKHGGTGTVYVPHPALDALAAKPRRAHDDLMFRTVRGKQFNSASLHHAWTPIRATFLAGLPADHHLRARLTIDPTDRLDFYELRHAGASYMLNILGLEPWVIARQLRHKDGGALVVKLYGHPSQDAAIDRMRRAFTPSVTPIVKSARETKEAQA